MKSNNRTVIIIPTYNHLDDCLKPCIESLMQTTHLDYNEGSMIVVVANGCTDGTHDYLHDMSEKYEWFHYRAIPEQLGYTKAMNIGISVALGIQADIDLFILLNNDTVMMPQEKDRWIDILAEGMKYDDSGISGPVKKNDEATGLPFIIFFCAMIHREVFEMIGLLDEVFSPGFGEDIDFCTKALKAGYASVQVPEQDQLGMNGKNFTGGFPIYHAGTKTFGEYDGYDEVVKRNIEILKQRYC